MGNNLNKPFYGWCRVFFTVFLSLYVAVACHAQTFNFKSSEASGIRAANQLYYHTLPDTITVWANEWNTIISNPTTWMSFMKFKSKHAFVKFSIDNFYTKAQRPFTYQMTYTAYGFAKNPAVDSTSHDTWSDTMTISSLNVNDPQNAYQDIQLAHLGAYYKTILIITGIYDYNGGSPVPAALSDSTRWNFNVESSILTQKYDKTDYGSGSSLEITTAASPTDNYLDVAFNLPGGSAPVMLTPVNYELEWAYVDDYERDVSTGSISHISSSALDYDFQHNSTRVWLDSSHYRIPLVYPEGYLVYRVRMVRPDSNTFNYPIYSDWSYSTADKGGVSSVHTDALYHISSAYAGDSLNWQYTVSFAEGGRYKQVSSFYDGLLKNRESITRFNTTPNKLIVTKNIYDYEGRPAIKTLPAPVSSGAFSFQHDVDLNSVTGVPYKSGDFDTGFNICPGEPVLSPLGSLALANIYYSNQNPDTLDYHKFVPDAEGYPFVQTIYRPAFNDRVEKQGGAGARLQIADSNIITNFYVTTQQGALNTLFGLDIGWNGYYNMTVTKDPNMQLSMSVKDYEGKQVASAMIGTGPSPLDHAIDPINAPGPRHFNEDILYGSHQLIIDNKRIADKEFFNQCPGNDSIQYIYEFSPYPVCPGQYLSVKAHYYYELTDQCGDTVFSDDSTLGITGVVYHPVTFSGSKGLVHMEGAKYSVHKELSINPDDIEAAIDSFIHGPNCLLTEPYFVRKSVEKQIFPCPEAEKDPCILKKTNMIYDLIPGGKYADYDDSAGFVRADPDGSVFGWFPPVCEGCTGSYVFQDSCIMQHIPDTMVIDGITYFPLHTMSVDSFIMVYKLSVAAGDLTIAEALLPLHPEFCRACIFDTFKTMLLALPDMPTAEGQHLLYLDSLIAHDPLRSLIPGSGADSLATFPGGLVRLDQIELIKVYCGCGDSVMAGKCYSEIFNDEINNKVLINDYVKNKYFSDMIELYVQNRQRYVEDFLFATTSDSCEKCSSLRFSAELVGRVITSWGAPSGDIYDSVWAHGDSTASWLLRAMSSSTVLDSATLALYYDSAKAIYGRFDSMLCFGGIDSIIGRLNNCGNGDTLLLGAIRHALDSLCTAHVIPGGRYTPEIIRSVITSSGGTIDDLCNPYLTSCYGMPSPPSPGTEACLSDSFYTNTAAFLDRPAIINSFVNTGTPNFDTLNPAGNLFEHGIWTALGASSSEVICHAVYDVAHSLYVLYVYNDPAMLSPSTDTVKVYLRCNGSCPAVFAGGVGHTYSISSVNCISSIPGAFVSGLINEYSFLATVTDYTGGSATTCTTLGWTDTVETMTSRSNPLQGCVPCTQIRELYTRFTDTMTSYGVKGVDHPLYDRMLLHFMNYQLGQLYNIDQYKTFIESCALADSVFLPLYVGYSNLTFATVSDADSFIRMLDQVDTNYTFTWSFRDSSAAGITVCVDLNAPPSWELHKYRTAIRAFSGNYTAKVVDTPLAYLQGANVVGVFYAYPGTAIPTPSVIFGSGGTVGFSAPETRGLWMGHHYEPMDFYYVLDSAGVTPPYEVSRNIYEFQRYCYNNGLSVVMLPNFLSTVNRDYFKPHKQDFLQYNYRFQQLPPYTVLDSLQAQYLQSRIAGMSYQDVTYSKPSDPNTVTNLYIADSTMADRLFDTLVHIINSVATLNTVNPLHIFFDTNKVVVIPPPGVGTTGPPLMAYRCSDGTYWYRYFTTGDTMFNLFVEMPAWIPRRMHKYYQVISVAPPKGIVPALGDSDSRFFTLNMRKPGDPTVVQARGMANFVVSKNEELDNVLLGDPVTEHAARPRPDTFNTCERQILSYAIRQGIVDYNSYIDSMIAAIRSGFMSYMLHGVKEQLLLGYINQEFAHTLYYYDRAGNLTATVPPGGVAPVSYSVSTLIDTAREHKDPPVPFLMPAHTKVSKYEYNSINQVVQQNTPDGGTTRFFYDPAGRLVFSQNARQAPIGMCTYNLYDHKNRIIETGEVALICPLFVEYQGCDTTTIFPTCYYTVPEDTAAGTYIITPYAPPLKLLGVWPHDSIIHFIRNSARVDVVTTTYDTAAAQLDTIPGMPAQRNLRKRVSSVSYDKYVMGHYPVTQEYVTHYSYDIEGNVTTLVHDCPEMGELAAPYSAPLRGSHKQQRYKRVDYDYDLISGKVTLLSYNRGFADQYYQRYGYDADNRITKVETSSDGFIWHQDAAYSYYQHGPLARVDVGDQRVQGLDYAYTIQGWLKIMNGDTLNRNMDMGQDASVTINANDAAAYSIDYFKNDYKPITVSSQLNHVADVTRNLYNGNISRQTVTMGDFYKLNRQYAYDQLNRIHTANYNSVDPTTKALTGLADYRSNYDYDADGNITKLVRYGNDKGYGARRMDSLLYQYGTGMGGYSKNQVKMLAEAAVDSYYNDIKYNLPGGSTSPAYVYNEIGNTVKDYISSDAYDLNWNLYNKVLSLDSTEIMWSGGIPYCVKRYGLSFNYDGAGNRTTKHQKAYSTGYYRWYDEYYVRDAQGNILAIYKGGNKHRMGIPFYTAVGSARGIVTGPGPGGGVTPSTYLHGFILRYWGASPSFTGLAMTVSMHSSPFKTSILSKPSSYFLGASELLYHGVSHADSRYVPALVSYDRAGTDTLLGPALGAMTAAQPRKATKMLSWLLADTTLRPHVLGLLCTANADSLLYVALSIAGLDTVTGCDTLLELLENRLPEPQPMASTIVAASGSYPAQYGEFMRLVSIDSTIYATAPFSSVASAYTGMLRDVAAEYGDRAGMLAFFDSYGETGDLIHHVTTDSGLLVVSYMKDRDTYMDSFCAYFGMDYLDTFVALDPDYRPEMFAGRLVRVREGSVGPGLDLITVLNQTSFGLAEHDIYGSSRVGVKNYLPSQIGISWDSLSKTADTVRLWERKPWYSGQYQDVIKDTSLSPYGNTLTGKLVTTHLMGQKQYELTDHLGDVLATVSDVRTPDDTIGLHSISYYKPVLKSAYDYYPFGMLMPGRYTEDSLQHCTTLSQTKLVQTITLVSNPWVLGSGSLSTAGSAAITAGSGIVATMPAAEDAIFYAIPSIPLGIPQHMDLEVDSASDNFTAMVIQDDTLMLGSYTIPSGGASIIGMDYTASTSSLKLKIFPELGSGSPSHTGIKGLYVTDTDYVPRLVVSTECNDGKYRYGHNGQMKTNEWAGVGNHMTAKFWEQDTRTGRRYNLDPRPNPSVSAYSIFGNSPIWRNDVLGDTIGVNLFSKLDGIYNIARGILSHPKNDGVFAVFAHGNDKGVQYEDNTGHKFLAKSPKEFNNIMSANSTDWQNAMKDGKSIVVVLYSCNTGANEYFDSHFTQSTIKNSNTIAQQISNTYPNVTVVAPNGYVWYGNDKSGRPSILGVQNDKNNGAFLNIKRGKITSRTPFTYSPNAIGGKKADGAGGGHESNGLSREQNDATIGMGAAGDVKISSLSSGGGGSTTQAK